MHASSFDVRRLSGVFHALCLVVAGLALVACGGGDDGDDGGRVSHDFDGLWLGELITETMPPLAPGTTLPFQQFVYGDRVMQRYPPSYSLITDGRQRVTRSRDENGKTVAEITGKVRNYFEKNYLVETGFRSMFVARDHFSSSVADAGYSAVLSGLYEAEMSEQVMALSELTGYWTSARADTPGSIVIDSGGQFTGEIGSCQIEDGRISALREGLNLLSIRFTRRCAGHDLPAQAFDGLMMTMKQSGVGSLSAVVTHPQVAMGLDFMQSPPP